MRLTIAIGTFVFYAIRWRPRVPKRVAKRNVNIALSICDLLFLLLVILSTLRHETSAIPDSAAYSLHWSGRGHTWSNACYLCQTGTEAQLFPHRQLPYPVHRQWVDHIERSGTRRI